MTPRRLLSLLLPLLMGCCMASAVRAGEWMAALPGGLILAVVQDTTRVRDGYVLERRYPDGRPDPQFGDGGSVVFSLGGDNEGPAALRVDGQGRAWVAGASLSPEGQRAVLLRFTPAGSPDRSFAQAGRAAVAPAGRDARAVDVLPQDDGSAWVAGTVVDAQGAERSGVWRVRNDGSVDPGFGLGGLWLDSGHGVTDSGGLQRSPDGQLAIGLRRVDGGRAALEVWVWRDGADLRRDQRLPLADAREIDRARLAWRDGRWQWSGASTAQVEAQAPAASPSAPAAANVGAEPPAAVIVTPFAAGPAAVASGAGTAAADGASAWWLLVPVGALACGWWWRRRRPPG